MNNTIKLAVIGSRDFADKRKMDEVLSAWPDVSLIISGGAIGADRMAERWAKAHCIQTQIFYPDHKRYRHPYHHRNRLIAEACDHLIAFWNGHSTGTKYTIDYARAIGKPVTVYRPR